MYAPGRVAVTVPKKSGWLTLVTSGVPVDKPLSLDGLRMRVSVSEVVGDRRVRVGDGQPGAAGVDDEGRDRVRCPIAA